MSEIDLISAYHQAEAIWQSYVSIFVSALFAYLLVAYFVGAKLSRAQASIITGCYAIFSLGVFAYLLIAFGRMKDFGTEIYEANPARFGYAADALDQPLGPILLWSPFIGTFIASLLFMFQIRHNAKNQRNSLDSK